MRHKIEPNRSRKSSAASPPSPSLLIFPLPLPLPFLVSINPLPLLLLPVPIPIPISISTTACLIHGDLIPVVPIISCPTCRRPRTRPQTPGIPRTTRAILVLGRRRGVSATIVRRRCDKGSRRLRRSFGSREVVKEAFEKWGNLYICVF